MKLTIERKSLITALGIVKSAAGGKTNLPILSHVALRTFDKSVELTCSNLDLTLRTKCEAEIEKKGDTTVSAALLASLAGSFTGDQVELELETIKPAKPAKGEAPEPLGGKLHLRCGQAKYELPTLAIEEFVPVSKPKNGDDFTLTQPVLRALLAATHFCSSTDASRYVLQGNLIKLNGELTTVATDGRRLAEMSHADDDLGKVQREFVLPADAVRELLRLLSPDAEKAERVRITAADNQAEFKLGDTVLTTKLIEGQFPNYAQVIPSTRGVKPVTLSRSLLRESLARVALVSGTVELKFNKQSLTILSVQDKDNKGTAWESLMTSPVEKPVRMKYNVRYLIDALGVIDDEEVLFFGKDALSPGVFRTPNNSKHNPGWTYVVMPMRSDEAETPAEAEAPEGKQEKVAA